MTPRGSLLLVPAPLDFGLAELGPVGDYLPASTLHAAAHLRHWVVENAKSARGFLKRVGALHPLSVPLQDIHIVELPRPAKGRSSPTLVDWSALLAPAHAGDDMGLLSEAGLPGVADPGAHLVARAHTEGIGVRSLAGSSSLTHALAASGLNGQSFAFLGYLPQDGLTRMARIRELEAASRRERQTQMVIETPYRNQALLDALVLALQPTTQLAVSRCLTTPSEWTRSAPVSRWRAAPTTLPSDQPAIFSWLAG